MIPGFPERQKAAPSNFAIRFLSFIFIWLHSGSSVAETPQSAPAALPVACLATGDGYLRARLKGAIDVDIDWPNAGTRCEGEERPGHEGLRLSFHRDPPSAPDLLFVFGISNIGENQPAHGAAVNLTVIAQGDGRIYGTRGDSRCTIDSLRQTRLEDAAQSAATAPPAQRPTPQSTSQSPLQPRRYRIEARGFCIGPARAVHGEGSVLVTRFDFAGAVSFDPREHGNAPALGNPQEHDK